VASAGMTDVASAGMTDVKSPPIGGLFNRAKS